MSCQNVCKVWQIASILPARRSEVETVPKKKSSLETSRLDECMGKLNIELKRFCICHTLSHIQNSLHTSMLGKISTFAKLYSRQGCPNSPLVFKPIKRPYRPARQLHLHLLHLLWIHKEWGTLMCLMSIQSNRQHTFVPRLSKSTKWYR